MRLYHSRWTGAIREETAALDYVREAARQFNVEVKTQVEAAPIVEEAILRVARQGQFNLVVVGVNRRRGADLSFGMVAHGLMATTERSLVFFSGEK
jgi:nucleotide-binding universal stress UspA family protein